MTSISATSKKVDWEEVRGDVFLFAVIGIVVYYAIIAANEGNKMFWWGVLAALTGLVALATSDCRRSKRGTNAQILVGSLFTVFALVSPFMHLGMNGVFVNEKVWMVNGETTMSHDVLWRSPFSRFATSINKKQDVLFTVSGNTKDGVAVTATLSGKFQISRHEKVVIAHLGAMENPDADVKMKLEAILQQSFEKVIATVTMADIVKAKNNFAIEHAIATIVKVDTLGLIGNGPIVVEYLHPYFTGK